MIIVYYVLNEEESVSKILMKIVIFLNIIVGFHIRRKSYNAKSVQFSGDLHYPLALFTGYKGCAKKCVSSTNYSVLISRSRTFCARTHNPGFVLQYLWNEANNHITIFDAPKYDLIVHMSIKDCFKGFEMKYWVLLLWQLLGIFRQLLGSEAINIKVEI